MDSLCTAAARALAAGDPLGALGLVALRDDASALALRGVAMAQLGDFERSKQLLRRAVRAFGPREGLAKARAAVAAAEVALAARELSTPASDARLRAALRTLRSHGDRQNELHAKVIAIRRQLMLGRVREAQRASAALDLAGAPHALVATASLLAADIALMGLAAAEAGAALERAREAAHQARIAALSAEVEHAFARLRAPAARLIRSGDAELVTLGRVEALYASKDLLIDACRRVVRDALGEVSFARRPVLMALARCLGRAWPTDAPRETLIETVFGVRRINDSHRARLRVEIGRLRKALQPLAEIAATARGFSLAPKRGPRVAVLAPPVDAPGASLLALLADGQAWSTSALALALGQSQRTVQRALAELEAAHDVQSFGRARARRWLTTRGAGFATPLLLPTAPSGG